MIFNDSRKRVAIVLALSMLAFFTRLGSSKLWDRDEPRNARCAVEMLERGDWIVPTFNGELRTHKPVLLYWLMMLAYSLFGTNEFSARFWSAALSTGTVLVTYHLASRLFGRGTAMWSAVVLSTTLMFNVAAHAATPDAALIFFSTLSITCLTRTVALPVPTNCPKEPADSVGHSGAWTALAYVAMSLGVLAKGPIGFLLPTAVWVAFLICLRPSESFTSSLPSQLGPDHGSVRGRFDALVKRSVALSHQLIDVIHQLRPGMAVGVLALVAGPWYLAVSMATQGEWLREFLINHNFERAMHAREGHAGSALFYYPIAILVGFFPWSILAAPLILWVRVQFRTKGNECYVLLICWIAVYVFLFSLAGTKLPSYVTPVYPALAVLTGQLITGGRNAPSAVGWIWARAASGCLVLVGLILCALLPILIHQQLPGDEWLSIVGLVPIIGGIASYRCFSASRWQPGFTWMAGMSYAWILALFAVAAPCISRHQQFEQLIRSSEHGGHWASLGIHEPSWIFYADRTIPFLTSDKTREARQILERRDGRLITSMSIYDRLRSDLPDEVQIVAQVPYFLRNDQLIVVGR